MSARLLKAAQALLDEANEYAEARDGERVTTVDPETFAELRAIVRETASAETAAVQVCRAVVARPHGAFYCQECDAVAACLAEGAGAHMHTGLTCAPLTLIDHARACLYRMATEALMGVDK